jgi:SAM-dependent methyltransferase
VSAAGSNATTESGGGGRAGGAIGALHGAYVHGRRVRVLASWLTRLLPRDASVLDVGCGDGLLASLIQRERPDLRIVGIDVLVRQHTHVPVQPFDGAHIPLPDGGVDVVTFVDVLHHTLDPMVLLREADRVARTHVVIKDHTANGVLARPTLRFMDRVGNARHGVALPYNYWTRRQWDAAFTELGWEVEAMERALGLYPVPANWLFGRGLHFIGSFRVSDHPEKRAKAQAMVA